MKANNMSDAENAEQPAVDRDEVRATDLGADAALEKIRNGEVLENVRIRGLRLRGEFAHPIEMKHVTLIRPQFDRATFKQPVSIVNCQIDHARFSRKSVFEQGLNFAGSTLRRCRFAEVTVRGAFRCDNVRTVGVIQFIAAQFEGDVRFWEARFGGWVDFRQCQFHALADFRSLTADEGLVFDRCQFLGDLLMRGATVGKKLDLTTSHAEAAVDFAKAKLHDFAYMEGLAAGPRQQFSFLNAIAERILIRPEQIEGRLASERSRDYVAAMQEYGLLKRNYEQLHRYEEEDWAFYRFKINQRRSHHRSWARPWTKLAELLNWLLLDLGCGYGTNPMRAVRAAILITLGFAGVYAWGFRDFHMAHAPISGIGHDALPNRLLYALMTSVSVFTSGLGGDLLSRAEGWMFLPLGVEAVLGTLLWGLFIVAFGRKVIR
jgi:hypothetical protein